MKKTLLLLLFTWLSIAAFAQNNPREYIEKYKDLAIRNMNTYGTPASVILAVAMHESANGNSKIARYLHNHFGMKGRNSSKEIRSSYKGYESPESSYNDFTEMLSRRKQFSHLFKFSDSDYRSWIKGISRGGYAASKTWASQVLATIKKYRLYEYDNKPDISTEAVAAHTQSTKPASAKKYTASNTVYRVKKGDTLNTIAQKHGVSVKVLKKKNSLRSSTLSVGQKLKI